MATWDELVEYVRSTYKVATEDNGLLGLIFETEGGRAQEVFILRHPLLAGEQEWIHIESPIGSIDGAEVPALMEAAGGMVCGGLVGVNELVVFRHSVPLGHIDPNDFEQSLAFVTLAADRLESQYFASDQH